jgi:hypothetical protein
MRTGLQILKTKDNMMAGFKGFFTGSIGRIYNLINPEVDFQN